MAQFSGRSTGNAATETHNFPFCFLEIKKTDEDI
jgi:hypothetical protein